MLALFLSQGTKKFIIQPSNPFNERAFWANFENKSNQGIALFSVVANEYGFQFNSDLASIKVHYNSDLELTSLIFRANSSYHLLCHLLQHLSENEFTIETRRDNFMKFIKLESRISDYRDGNMLDFIL